MSENEIKNEIDGGGEDTAPKNKFLAWLDNFWYHYKWHSIIALFLVFTISICSFQMCAKEQFDIYIVYAGKKQISRTASNGNFSEYATVTSSLKNVVGDYDENGEALVSLLDLFMLSNAEIAEIEKNEDIEVNSALIRDNNEKFNEIVVYSTYYLCLLSEKIYKEYKTMDGVELFTPIRSYAKDKNVKYLDDNAIYLHGSGLSFAELPGISDLPEDTVICLRSLSAVASYFDKKDNREQYERAERSLEKILATYKEQ